ncbi:acyltransferase [Neobacillus sp. OS1-33]|jgi:serine/alanine racemase|uniref:acyltransferase n=1 Tax=Neobacillus sp. OS1-33 TaxID=3070683 RepID=UPI0027DF8DDB|nr:acyltransferase [Neobacillus sp. OS1-33]WML25157.1 acyltransferase [Neobacillus sp. OS1-33]
MTSVKNNNAVDVMKFICAILVVIIHAPPLLSYNEIANFILVEIIARIAVPFFFVCAGYFFFNKINLKNGKVEMNISRLKNYILHLINLYIFWTLFYLIWWIPLWYHSGFLTLANIKGYVLSIFLTGSYFHMWYIVSLIYGMIFSFLLLRYIRVKLVIAIAVIFNLIGTFVYSYSWIISENILVDLFINLYDLFGSISVGLFRAFPYLMMGLFFSKYRVKITNSLSVILSGICILLLCLEVWLLKTSGDTSKFSYVLLTGVNVFFIFNTVSKIKLKFNTYYPLLRKMSSIIYFVHPMFININGLILSHYFDKENSAILFFSVLGCTVLFSAGFIKLSQSKYYYRLKSVY